MNHEALEENDDPGDEHVCSLHLNGSHFQVGFHVTDQGGPRDYSGPQTLDGAAQAWAELQLEHGLVQSFKLVKKLVPVYTMALSNWDQQFLSRIVLSA